MKVGEYVRTKQGYIAKIEDKTNNAYWCDDTVEFVYEPDISIQKNKVNKIVIKSSPNIIDLLEPNDFIKYKLIYNGYEKNQILYKCIKDGRDLLDLKYRINNKKISIKSILTKEQFESMEYRIGE